MIEKEKNPTPIKDNLKLLGSIFSIITGIGFVWTMVEVLIAKMTIFILYCFGAVFFFSLGIILFFLWAKQRCDAHIEKKEEEIRALNSKYEEKTKEYDGLFELTKLPPEDEIITIEPSAYQEVVKREVSGIPYLHFKLNVHNHSYYHFTPKRVELKCSNSGKEVVEDVWAINKDKEYISARKHITISESLPKYQARSIIFKVPIEKAYPDWSIWDFEGCVTYTNGEEERNVTIETHHHLSDQNIHKLEVMRKNVLGEGE